MHVVIPVKCFWLELPWWRTWCKWRCCVVESEVGGCGCSLSRLAVHLNIIVVIVCLGIGMLLSCSYLIWLCIVTLSTCSLKWRCPLRWLSLTWTSLWWIRTRASAQKPPGKETSLISEALFARLSNTKCFSLFNDSGWTIHPKPRPPSQQTVTRTLLWPSSWSMSTLEWSLPLTRYVIRVGHERTIQLSCGWPKQSGKQPTTATT